MNEEGVTPASTPGPAPANSALTAEQIIQAMTSEQLYHFLKSLPAEQFTATVNLLTPNRLREAMNAAPTSSAASTTLKPEKIDVPTFDGEDPASYPAWENIVKAKFANEAARFGSQSNAVWFANGKLRGKAARLLGPWIDTYKTDSNEFTVDNFLAHMKIQFGDVDRKSKALDEIQNLKQHNRTFEDVLGEYQRLLLESGASMTWGVEMKISMLRKSLNFKLQQAVISVVDSPTYEAYVRSVRQIADNLESLNRRSQNRPNYRRNPRQYDGQGAAQGRRPVAALESMDWEPTNPRVMAMSGKRAKAIDDREYQRRQEERRCYNCGSSEHLIAACPHGRPKRREARREAKPKVAKVKIVQPELETETEEEDSEYEEAKE